MRSRDSVVFTALVGTVMFVGAGVMALVLLAAGAPQAPVDQQPLMQTPLPASR